MRATSEESTIESTAAVGVSAPGELTGAPERRGEEREAYEGTSSRGRRGPAPRRTRRRGSPLRRHWKALVTFLPLVCAGLALYVAERSEEQYAAYASVLVDPDDVTILDSRTNSAAAPERRIDTEAELFSSAGVRARIEERIGRPVEYVVSVGSGTNLLTVQTTSDTPASAAELADLVAETYLAERQDIERRQISDSIEVVASQITELEAELVEIEAELADTDEPPAVLLARQAALSNQAAVLETRVNELQIESDSSIGAPRLASRAVPPLESTALDPVKSYIAGLVVGTLLAAALFAIGERRRWGEERDVDAPERDAR